MWVNPALNYRDSEKLKNYPRNKTRMEMHRMVYGALEDLIPKKIHALSIKAKKPNA